MHPLVVEIHTPDDTLGAVDDVYGLALSPEPNGLCWAAVRFGPFEARFLGYNRDDAINRVQATLRRIADDLDDWRV